MDDTQEMTAAMVVEWAPFRLRDGVTPDQVIEAADALQREFLDGRDGFLGRELLQGGDGQWADLVRWRDEAAAHAIMDDLATSPACQRYFGLMVGADPADPAAGVQHLRRIRAF
jgi:hypothetical protein